MQVRNWGAANRLATSANDIQSKIDMVYSSVRDSVNTQGTPSPHIKMIGQELQAGEKKERARGRMLARGSQDGSRLVRAVQVMILRCCSHSWENSRYNVTLSKGVCKADPVREVGVPFAVIAELLSRKQSHVRQLCFENSSKHMSGRRIRRPAISGSDIDDRYAIYHI